MTIFVVFMLTGRRRGQADAARQIYLAAIQRSDLDWPEAVYEALSRFETVHGSIETTLQSARKIEKESEKLARRREKVAREQAAYQYTETQVMSEIAEAEPVAEEVTTSVVAAPATDTETSIKRYVAIPVLADR
jgi:ribosomal protein L17